MKILSLSGEDILATQHVTRWHMVRTRRHQSLAEHLSVVAMLAVRIDRLWRENPTAAESLEVLDHALTHDAHEVEYGDLPAIMKDFIPPGTEKLMEMEFWQRRALPASSYDDVPEFARRAVRLADKLEAAMFYTLEGADHNLRMKMKAGVLGMLADAPVSVREWVDALLLSVEVGTFTPQPGKSARP